MKWLFLLFLVALISVGCDQVEAPPSTEAPGEEVIVTNSPPPEKPAAAAVEPAGAPEVAAKEESVALPPAQLTAVPTSEVTIPANIVPTISPAIITTQEPPAEETVAYNGLYENSYFRGAANAPVTILDYSDFL